MRRGALLQLFPLVVALLLNSGCPAEKPDCKGSASVCGGTCTDLRTDNANCGACGTVCDAGQLCSAGTCALSCQAALVECASTCVDPLSSPDHCGATLGCGVGGVGLAGAVCGGFTSCFRGYCLPIGPSLDPTTIPQFVAPLVIPPAMPKATLPANAPVPLPDSYYEIAAAQFLQQVLPPGYPPTTVWGYGKVGDPSTFNYPAFTIEVRRNEKVRVKWVNALVNASGGYLPHLFPVDDTIHWANPPDSMEMTGLPYTGPVPIVAHVHGAHVADHSDGNPDDWFLPAANDLPPTYLKRGAFTPVVPRLPSGDGYALYEYTNDQDATTVWFHDHALGITRLNVMAGLAGFWLLRSPVEDGLGLPGPAPARGDAAGTPYYEIPLAIQDRSFKVDGAFDYPDSRALFDGFAGPYLPEPGATVSPIWNPEFFGNAIVVNGRTWPYLEVEARLYRFRLLNGCNSRFLKLALSRAGIPFQQIGSDSGLLPAVAPTAELLLGPGERADVLVDFSGVAPGTDLTLLNFGPDEPYKGPAEPLPAANPVTTGRVMQLRVVADTGRGVPGAVPASLPAITPLTTTLPERELTLNELVELVAEVPEAAKLGTAADGALDYAAAATETPTVGSTEIWRVVNLTADAHPIHLHLVTFQVLTRRPIDVAAYDLEQAAHLADPAGVPPPDVMNFLLGPAVGPMPNEAGWKDTVVANPGEVTRLIATFDLAGKYVWHCHILEHEDNEMMRPLVVIP
jgi:FtsP/CotA-like multicopper oxidase with cupredoxin domain